MIAVKDATLYDDGNELPDLGDDSSSDEDDSSDDEEEEDKKTEKTPDRIGDIEKKLKTEKCKYVKTSIDSSNLNIITMIKSFMDWYNEFKDGDTYPNRKRYSSHTFYYFSNDE